MATSSKLTRLTSTFTPLAIAAIALVGVVWMQRSRLNQPSLWVSDPQAAEQQEAWRLTLLKQTPTFGFDNLLADWTFLNFLQYYGDTPLRKATGYSLSPEYFDLITRLDPRFVETYLFLSGSISYQLGKPETAVALMERGAAQLSPQIHPNAYLVWRFKGLDELLLLGDVPASIHSHEMAAQWAADSPNRDLAPIFAQTARFLRKDPNSVLARFQAWTMVYEQATASRDKATQARAKRELLAIGAQVSIKDGQVMFTLPHPAKSAPSKSTKSTR